MPRLGASSGTELGLVKVRGARLQTCQGADRVGADQRGQRQCQEAEQLFGGAS
jgi:hypothetical protein